MGVIGTAARLHKGSFSHRNLIVYKNQEDKGSPGVGEYNITRFTNMSKANFSSFNISNSFQIN